VAKETKRQLEKHNLSTKKGNADVEFIQTKWPLVFPLQSKKNIV
jgi:hypothetical protein